MMHTKRFIVVAMVALIGSYVQKVSVGWTIWEMTHNTRWLAAISLSELIPVTVLSLSAGSIVDRNSPRMIFLLSQVIVLLQASLLAFISASGSIRLSELFICTIISGICNAFNYPARLAYVALQSQPEEYSKVIVFLSIGGNLAYFVAPIIAGPLISKFGASASYSVSALTCLPAIVFLLRARSDKVDNEERRESVSRIQGDWSGLKEIVNDDIALVYNIASFAAAALTARGILELAPSLAGGTLHGNVNTLSILMGSLAVGALSAGLVMFKWKFQSRTTTVCALIGTAISLALYGSSGQIIITAFSATAMGFFLAINNIQTGVIVQTRVNSSNLGRANALLNLIFRGGPAIGALIFGFIASEFGLVISVLAAAGILFIASFAIGFYVHVKDT